MKFLEDVVTGNASSNVSALYFLGDIEDDVQIRVSTTSNNKSYPDNDECWKDFYDLDNTSEKNTALLLNAVSSDMLSSLEQHAREYHMPEIEPSQASIWLQSQGFFKRDSFDPDSVKTQKFFDHNFCQLMQGFDYAVSFKHSGTSWCRVWRSGYVEQGGFVENDGSGMIKVSFLEPYNYPNGVMFYQSGFDQFADEDHSKVASSMSQSRRYSAFVTPVKNTDASNAYPDAKVYDGEIVYASVDIANMTNTSFSFVNVDAEKKVYSKYSWHACGYRT